MNETGVKRLGKSQPGQDEMDAIRAWSRHRVLIIGYLLVAALLFAALAVEVRQTPYFGVDLAITRAVQSFRTPALDVLMQLVGESGFFPQVLLLNALFIIILYLCRLRWSAVVLLIGGGLTGIVTTALRHGIDRPRPTPDLVFMLNAIENGRYSFPSGHVAGFTAVLGFIAYLGYTRLKPSWHRNLILALYVVFIALVGLSRIYVGEHWPTDVFAGYLLGSIFLVLMIALHQWGRQRWAGRQPGTRAPGSVNRETGKEGDTEGEGG